jgi:glyoxylase-like metal-dependent hydrolase (beta-lactamase superfamily II)
MRIHAIETGRVLIKQAQLVGRGHGWARRLQPIISPDWAEWVPVYAFAIEHRDGVIVVDTGSNTGLKSLPRWHPFFQFAVRFDIENEQEIGPQLRALGIGPRDVRKVVLTHLHIDHDGGLKYFPNAEIVADRGEIALASALKGALLGYLPRRWPGWFDPRPLQFQPGHYGPFPASAPLTADGSVIAVPTPGHTPHHVSVVVDDGDSRTMIAGDAAYLERAMLDGAIDGISPDEAVTAATLADIRTFCAARPTVFLPAHDPLSANRLKTRQAAAPLRHGRAAA